MMSKPICNKKKSDISFRWATLDDFAAVKRISDSVYNGLDYIPDAFPSMIQHPLFFGAVGEIENEVVAFVGGYVQNNNTRLITKGGRVNEKFNGQGFYRRLLAYLQTELKIKFPSLQTRQFFCGTTNLAIGKLSKNEHHVELFRQGMWLFKPSTELVEPPPIDCSRLNRESFSVLLSNKNTREEVFPHKVFVKWEMCDPVLDELEFIFSQTPTIFHSENRDVCVVTIGGLIRSTSGMLYIVQCHVTPSADVIVLEQILQVHITNHVKVHVFELTNDSKFVLIIPQKHTHVLKRAALKQGFALIPFFNDTFIVYSQDL